MTLFKYIIKILMSNSDTIFLALVMGVFGYIGWLLWKVNESLNSFLKEWEKHQESLNNIKRKMDRIDDGVYKDLMNKLEQSVNEMDKLSLIVNDNNDEIERMRVDTISEIKESTKQIKDIVLILMNNRVRGIIKKDCNSKEELNKRIDKIIEDDKIIADLTIDDHRKIDKNDGKTQTNTSVEVSDDV